MKMKTKLVFKGFIAGLAIFGPTSSATAQTCHQMPGELQIVSAEAGGQVASQHDANQIYNQLMNNLNKNAQKACLGGRFCIERSSIKYENNTTIDGFLAFFSNKATAIVNCLE